MPTHEQRDGPAGGSGALSSILKKTTELALKLAALGLSYAAASGWVGAVKSSVCRWLRRTPLQLPQLAGRVLELDGLWTRTRAGRVEMKVVRDENGVALGSFSTWSEVIDQAWQLGAAAPVHLVSDGDRAIAEGIAMVYGSKAPHQLCHFHLLREYRRNLGWEGWQEARQLLASESLAQAVTWARRVVALTKGWGRYWCEKALTQGLRHLETGEWRYKTTSRLERQNREYRRREKMGTVWSPHNLLALLQKRGLINQTT